MIVRGLVDKIQFVGWPFGSPKTDDIMKHFVHSVEVSDERSLRPFITFYTLDLLTDKQKQSLIDILPNPGHHNDSIYHREGDENRPLTERDFHFHILFDQPLTDSDIVYTIFRLDDLGFNPTIRQEILTYYFGYKNSKHCKLRRGC